MITRLIWTIWTPMSSVPNLSLGYLRVDWSVSFLWPSYTLWSQWTGSLMAQLMACRLFGAMSSTGPILTYCQLDIKERISAKFESKYTSTFFQERHLHMFGDQLTTRWHWITNAERLLLVTLTALWSVCQIRSNCAPLNTLYWWYSS